MSIWIEDYIPFDYMRYGTEILPAIDRAARGDTTVLREILASATHFSPKIRSKYALPLLEEQSDPLIEIFEGLFAASTLRRIRTGEAWNPWEVVAAALPTLEGQSLAILDRFGEMLKYHLLATFCCEVPPWSGYWLDPYGFSSDEETYHGPILWHDEVVYSWHDYCVRDKEMQALWGTFYGPVPLDLTDMLHIDDQRRSFYMPENEPRHIATETYTERELAISGFMTQEEILYLLDHVRTHEWPLLDSIINKCIRDGESRYWPIDVGALGKDAIKSKEEIEEGGWYYFRREEMQLNERAVFEQWMKVPHHRAELEQYHLRRFYGILHKVEDEILHRMRFAVERGWGILVMNGKL